MSKDRSNRPDRRAVLAAAPALALAAESAARADPPAGPTPGVEFALEAIVTLAAAQTPGVTPYGKRNRVPITGGTFRGPRISGKVLSGGADWQLTRADGVTAIEADYMIQADDGALIHVYNKGMIVPPPAGGPGVPYFRTTPVFEAPIGPHDWLNKAVFVGTADIATGQPGPVVRIRAFRVT